MWPLGLHAARHIFASLALAAGRSIRWDASTVGGRVGLFGVELRDPYVGVGEASDQFELPSEDSASLLSSAS